MGNSMFRGAENFTNSDILLSWDTANVQNFSWMFYGAKLFDGSNLLPSTWDTSSAEDMRFMFSYAENFNNDISKNWNTSNVKYMNSMFEGTKKFNQPIGELWNVANVVNMSHMFQNTEAFNQPLWAWKPQLMTGNQVSAEQKSGGLQTQGMFSGATAF